MATARDAARKRARLYSRGIAPPLNATRLEALRKNIADFNQIVTTITNAAADAAPRAASPAEAS
jgi:hypothetical protein